LKRDENRKKPAKCPFTGLLEIWLKNVRESNTARKLKKPGKWVLSKDEKRVGRLGRGLHYKRKYAVQFCKIGVGQRGGKNFTNSKRKKRSLRLATLLTP